jgi:transaldolase
VKSVQTIYNYYKSNGIDTIVMGASFRNTGQIKALAGCDNLTISPALLEELGSEEAALPRALSPDTIEAAAPVEITASSFRFNIATDPMANELLAGGIRSFDADFKKMLARVA